MANEPNGESKDLDSELNSLRDQLVNQLGEGIRWSTKRIADWDDSLNYWSSMYTIVTYVSGIACGLLLATAILMGTLEPLFGIALCVGIWLISRSGYRLAAKAKMKLVKYRQETIEKYCKYAPSDRVDL